MALPVITDVIRVAVEGHAVNGHKWANVLHFRKTGVLTYTGAIAILDPLLLAHYTVNNGAGTCWKNLAPTLAGMEQFRYTPLDGISASAIWTHAVAGASAGDPLPAQVALVVSLRTAKRGRRYRGRVYQGPMDESTNTSGAPTAAAVTAISTQWTNFLTALAGSGVSLVVATYGRYKVGLPPGAADANDVTSVSVDGRWDTQRRRLRT